MKLIVSEPAPAARIFAVSITFVLKTSKSFQPDVPASTTVVTPDEKVLTCGSSERRDRWCQWKTCACMSMMPGVT